VSDFATIKRRAAALAEDLEMAHLANGGREFRQDWCECDPETGMTPCRYCAIHSVLTRTERLLKEISET